MTQDTNPPVATQDQVREAAWKLIEALASSKVYKNPDVWQARAELIDALARDKCRYD